ncbi:hypothetical protein [Lysinibacillus fusiformis]|uniref:hypothetical protein n=1 Tax=Lysinibacillus fusiformis TaxID=28031 RepID=UPI003556A40E
MAAKTKTSTKKKEPKHMDRDEFDLEEIAYALTEAMENNQIKAFTIYKKEGRSANRYSHKNGCKH